MAHPKMCSALEIGLKSSKELPDVENGKVVDYLGAGTFASVYTIQPWGGEALKPVADPCRHVELQKEFRDLQLLHKTFKAKGLFMLPTPFAHFDFFVAYLKGKGLEDLAYTPPMLSTQALYTMERVWPLPPGMSITIQNRYFPPKYQLSFPYRFIARIYIGHPSSRVLHTGALFFNHKNFPLTLDQLMELELSVSEPAHDMGLMLGSTNFLAHRDGRDIEFVVGAQGQNSLELQYYCIDFNQMQEHEGSTSTIVESFLRNDPYYPRPGTPFWNDFVRGYLKSTTRETSALAREVIAGIEEAERMRASNYVFSATLA